MKRLFLGLFMKRLFFSVPALQRNNFESYWYCIPSFQDTLFTKFRDYLAIATTCHFMVGQIFITVQHPYLNGEFILGARTGASDRILFLNWHWIYMFDPVLQYSLQYALKCAHKYRTCFGFCSSTLLYCVSGIFIGVLQLIIVEHSWQLVVTLYISNNYKIYQSVTIIVATKFLDN